MPSNVQRLKDRLAAARKAAGLPPPPHKCCKAILGLHTKNCPKKGIKKQPIVWISDLPEGMETCCPDGMHKKDCFKGTGLTNAK